MANLSVGSKIALRPGSARQPAPKELKKKKTLKEVAGSMLLDMAEKAKEERIKSSKERQKQDEDAVARMIFGPDPVELEIDTPDDID